MIEEESFHDKVSIEQNNKEKFVEHFNKEAEKQDSNIRSHMEFNEYVHIRKRIWFFPIFNIQVFYDINKKEFSAGYDERVDIIQEHKKELIPILKNIPEKFIIHNRIID